MMKMELSIAASTATAGKPYFVLVGGDAQGEL